MRSFSLFALLLIMLASLHVCAQEKKAASSGASALKIADATQKNLFLGSSNQPPAVEYRFSIVWQSKTPPANFFWRPDRSSWIAVKVTRPQRRPLFPGSPDYMVMDMNIYFKEIKYGDNLTIVTEHHIHDDEQMPASVRNMPVMSLYYQVSGSAKWSNVMVKPRKLPDSHAR